MATDFTTLDKAYQATNDVLDAVSQIAVQAKTKAADSNVSVADLLSLSSALKSAAEAASTLSVGLVTAKKGLPKTVT